MNKDIYSNIFELTKSNIESAGGEFSVSKEAFIELSGIHPQNADVFLLSREENNRVFLEKAYIRLLKRLADTRAYENWGGRFNLPVCEFQRMVVYTILQSKEFSEKNVNVYNNIYSLHNQYKGVLSDSKKLMSVRKAEFHLKFYCILKKIYYKLPEKTKNMLKKLILNRRHKG